MHRLKLCNRGLFRQLATVSSFQHHLGYGFCYNSFDSAAYLNTSVVKKHFIVQRVPTVFSGDNKRPFSYGSTSCVFWQPMPLCLSYCTTSNPKPQKPASWSPPSVWTPSNIVSVGRLVSGPVVSVLIAQHSWAIALGLTAISGASDWLDGYLARKYGHESVLGSYLDPLADKVLIACVVSSLAYENMLPLWVASVVIGRDVVLVTGMIVHRANMMNWKWHGWSEFFKTTDAGREKLGQPGVPAMRPLLISKLNTCLQIALICSCLSFAAFHVPAQEALWYLEALTGGTTVATTVAYAQQYTSGKLLKSL